MPICFVNVMPSGLSKMLAKSQNEMLMAPSAVVVEFMLQESQFQSICSTKMIRKASIKHDPIKDLTTYKLPGVLYQLFVQSPPVISVEVLNIINCTEAVASPQETYPMTKIIRGY